jgi:hypothetical protein
MKTAMYYPPIYDENGVNTNPDGNITTTYYTCLNCNKMYTAQYRYGELIKNEKE